MNKIIIAVLFLSVVSSGYAQLGEPVKDKAVVKGYGFDWANAPLEKCHKINPKFVKKMACEHKREDISNEYLFECKSKTSSYLIFKTRKQCEYERFIQDAQSD